ncbi:MAG: hypothetical protein L6244_05295 [Candidatus Methanoperedenaceae archaeon]|nr:hypothetical protein [Euryarchaeota archaeon]MCG2728045.1 hypothetical protein [Candidatus Methanoperedenaceae archaeon]
MKKEEAKRVLEIMALADGGCIYCVKELFNRFIEEFPEFTDIAKEIFKKKFDIELEAVDDEEES